MIAKNNDNDKMFKNYIEQKKKLQEYLLDYIEDDDSDDVNYNDLIKIIQEQQIFKSCNELEPFLCLLMHISNSHHRNCSFFEKIKRIIKEFESKIKQRLSNHKIFHIFMSNKIILLFLIQELIITLDEIIIKEISILVKKSIK